MTKLEQIVTALIALTKAVPDVCSVATHTFSDDRAFVRLSVRTQEGLSALVAASGASVRTVDYGESEWEVGEVRIGDIALELSGPHRPRHVFPQSPPAELGDAADAALAQATEALS